MKDCEYVNKVVRPFIINANGLSKTTHEKKLSNLHLSGKTEVFPLTHIFIKPIRIFMMLSRFDCFHRQLVRLLCMNFYKAIFLIKLVEH